MRYAEDTECWDEGDTLSNSEREQEIISVERLLSKPNPLMSKVEFCPTLPKWHYPSPPTSLPIALTVGLHCNDRNNMSMIEESAFLHQKMKKDFEAVMLGSNNLTNFNDRIPLQEKFRGLTPIYSKFNQHTQQPLGVFILEVQKSTVNSSTVSKKLQQRMPSHTSSFRNIPEFSSNFESGNLFQVYHEDTFTYNLLLQNDINTYGNNQWFFFSVRNVPKGQTLKFNILNLTKKHSLFEWGMKPCVFSLSRWEKRRIGWIREGQKVCYNPTCYKRNENAASNPYYCLSFEYKFIYEGDVVYFAHSVPYTFTQMNNFFVSKLRDKKIHKKLRLKDLATTLGGNEVKLLEISDYTVSSYEKKIVWIVARQHSGETTSSFMCEGIINYLLGDEAERLLEKYVFKIVPMMNTDGVVHGNTRAEIAGADPNRKWYEPDKYRYPLLHAIKKCIDREKDNIEMFLDLHSHSSKLGTFFYGNSPPLRSYEAHLLPKLVCSQDHRFIYRSCRFKGGSETTARNVVYQKTGLPCVYTVESSFYGYQKGDFQIIQYTTEDYRSMGETIIKCFEKSRGLKYLQSNNNIEEIHNPETKITSLEEDDDPLLDGVCEETDSEPGEDDFDEKTLKKMVFKHSNIKKSIRKSVPKKSSEPKLNKIKIIADIPIPQSKDTSRIPTKRITPSPLISLTQTVSLKPLTPEFFSYGCQVDLPFIQSDIHSLQSEQSTNSIYMNAPLSRSNMNVPSHFLEQLALKTRNNNNLCIIGMKVEEEVLTYGNGSVSTQTITATDTTKISVPRNSLRLHKRAASILQVKENNFMNRADCGHTNSLLHRNN